MTLSPLPGSLEFWLCLFLCLSHSLLVSIHFLQLRGLVSLLGNALQMSGLKTGVPAPHPPPWSTRGQDGGEQPKRGDGVGAVLLDGKTLCVHLLTGL